MHLIWKTSFPCDACGKDATGLVYRKESDEPLREEQKPEILETLRHYHQIENHTTCWQCGKSIKPHQIAGVVYVDNKLKNLCGDCA